ncbi:hypothetical protein [Helcococcus kunzii]|uniref:hypothetical protein n=1 Tax=Helcococcus kunzii TaxID=40091 RepID=UPI0021A72C1E|nr:hypothetical protein [Helcococcus kunzii]MCT1796325.1 hypothetical protein [Helcococcus kunzii]MCT1988995.1 hypothetical protein [Helcococcus kunzii]
MSQLIKYEFRNSRKQITQLIIIIGIVSFILQAIFNGFVRMEIAKIDITGPLAIINTLTALIVAGSSLLMFGTIIAYYLRLANILKTDIYQNRGYITFSLPRSGYQIIGAKLIVAVLWSFILPIVVVLWNILIWMILWVVIPGIVLPSELQEAINVMWREILNLFNQVDYVLILSIIVNMISSSLFYLLLIFTAVIADYRIGRRKSDSARWIIYAIIFALIWSFIQSALFGSSDFTMIDTTPYSVSINAEEIINYFTRNNFITAAFNGLAGVLLFVFVGYNLEKKIEK